MAKVCYSSFLLLTTCSFRSCIVCFFLVLHLQVIQDEKLRLQKLAERTEEVVNIPQIKLHFLHWTGELKKVNSVFDELEIKIDDTDVILMGNHSDVQGAKVSENIL